MACKLKCLVSMSCLQSTARAYQHTQMKWVIQSPHNDFHTVKQLHLAPSWVFGLKIEKFVSITCLKSPVCAANSQASKSLTLSVFLYRTLFRLTLFQFRSIRNKYQTCSVRTKSSTDFHCPQCLHCPSLYG